MKIKLIFNKLWPLLLILFLAILTELLEYNGLYGQDAHAYFQYTRKLKSALIHQSEIPSFFWPVYYPLSGVLLSFLPFSQVKVLQLISISSLVGVTWLLSSLLNKQFTSHKSVILFVLSAFFLAPTPFIYALSTMSDSLTVFFVMTHFYFAYLFYHENKNSAFIASAVFALLAFLTRYAAVPVLLPSSLWLTYLVFNRKKWLTISYTLLVLIIISLPHFYIKGFEQQYNHHWLSNWQVINFFQSSFVTHEGPHYFPRINLIYSIQHLFHPRFIFIGFPLLFFLRKEDFQSSFRLVVLASILLYMIFLGGIPYQSNRYLMLSFPLIIIVLFPAFNRAYLWIKHLGKVYFKLGITLFCIGQLTLIIYYFQPFYKRNQLEQNVVEVLKAHQAKSIYSFGMETAFGNYKIPQQIHSLWEHTYSSFVVGDLIFFNLPKYHDQWANQNPMINWEKLNRDYSLQPLQSWDDGWKLYMVAQKE